MWCNNPTALAFRITMRRMLAHCGQITSKHGNCVELEELSPDRVESLSAAVLRDIQADEREREYSYSKAGLSSLLAYEKLSIGYLAG